MSEWILSCKKALRLFLRRIYVSKKAHRERLLTRPLHDADSSPDSRPRRSCFTNLTLLCVLVACYFFLMTPSSPQGLTYSEKSIETPVVFNPRQVMKVHIPKEAKVELARKWLDRNEPITEGREENFLTTIPPKSFAELAVYAPGSVIFIDDNKTSSTTTMAPVNWIPNCETRVRSEKLTLNVSLAKVSLDNIYPEVQKGGYFKPSGCEVVHKVAILVPYRNRTRNLTIFLYNIHPFLMTQNLEYQIFVIEQFGNHAFNRGRLFNAGFKEIKKFGSWRCVILHDVDLLPLDRRIFYTCPMYPRHMSSHVIDKGSRRNTSSPIAFGGVTAMTIEHYEKANGHSNMYWGWGGEDYDMFWRIRSAMIPIVRYNKTIAKYIALPHPRAPENPARYNLIYSAIDRWQNEGLNTIDYKVISLTLRHLFTHIIVDIQPNGDVNNMMNTIKASVKRTKDIAKHRRRDQRIPSMALPLSLKDPAAAFFTSTNHKGS